MLYWDFTVSPSDIYFSNPLGKLKKNEFGTISLWNLYLYRCICIGFPEGILLVGLS